MILSATAEKLKRQSMDDFKAGIFQSMADRAGGCLVSGFAQCFRRVRQKRKFRPASITLSLRSDFELMPPLVVGTALLMT